jgi:hypothetical protein
VFDTMDNLLLDVRDGLTLGRVLNRRESDDVKGGA